MEYIGGQQNVVADCLSRIFSIASVEQDPKLSLNSFHLKLAQKRSYAELYQVLRRSDSNLTKSDIPGELVSVRQHLRILKGLIVFGLIGNRILIPTSMQQKVIMSAHYGHYNYDATLNRAKEKCFCLVWLVI